MSPYRAFLEATHGDRLADAGTYTSLGLGGVAFGLDMVAQAMPAAPPNIGVLGVVPLGIISCLTAFRIWQGNQAQRESHRHEERLIELQAKLNMERASYLNARVAAHLAGLDEDGNPRAPTIVTPSATDPANPPGP